MVVPTRRVEPLPRGRRICLCHDIERGRGHLDVDPSFAAAAEETSPESLTEMLAAEAEMNVRATYNVLGVLLGDVRSGIEAGGHAVAFHSYDHEVDGRRPLRGRIRGWAASRRRGAPPVDPREARQLTSCRRLDYRIKGYRPPRSIVSRELSDANLLFHNFEWLASSRSLGADEPRLVNGIVRIPVVRDDFDLHRRRLTYRQWEDEAIRALEERDFGAICLHDCYGPLWLSHYRGLLERVNDLGRLVTMDELAAEVALANGV